MKKLFLLLMMLFSTSASAAGRYVSTGGGADTTCPIGTPCNLATAMATARPGDTLYFNSGTYGARPYPKNTGSDSTTGMIIMIGAPSFAPVIGAATSGDTLVKFPGGTLGSKYVSWERMMFTSDVRFGPIFKLLPAYTGNAADSIYRIVGARWKRVRHIGSFVGYAFEWAKFDSVKFDTSGASAGYNIVHFTNAIDSGFAGMRTRANIIRNSTINVNTGRAEPIDVTYMFSITGDDGYAEVLQPTEFIFKNNTFNITNTPYATVGQSRGCYLTNAIACSFEDNTWNISDYSLPSAGTGTRTQFWRIRDISKRNKFLRDKFIVRGRRPGFQWSSTGGPNDNWDNDASYCTFDIHCSDHSVPYIGVELERGLDKIDFDHCIFKSNRNAVHFKYINSGGGSFTNNTFYPGTGYASISFDPYVTNGGWVSSATLTLLNNIYYVPEASPAAVDLAWASGYNLVSNYNLYYHLSFDKTKAIRFKVCDTGWAAACGPKPFMFSEVGTAAQSTWYSITSQDAQSKFGSPAFTDSTFDLAVGISSWNPRLTYRSLALFSDSGFVGAYPYKKLYSLFLGDSLGSLLKSNGTYAETTFTSIYSTCLNFFDQLGAAPSVAPNKLSTLNSIGNCDNIENWNVNAPATVDTVGKFIDAVILSSFVSTDEYLTGDMFRTNQFYYITYDNASTNQRDINNQVLLNSGPVWVTSGYLPNNIAASKTSKPWKWANIGTGLGANDLGVIASIGWDFNYTTSFRTGSAANIRLNTLCEFIDVYGSPF